MYLQLGRRCFEFKKILLQSFWIFVGVLIFMQGCSVGGSVQGVEPQASTEAPLVVQSPTIVSPVGSPYIGRNSSETITGQCTAKSTVLLSDLLGIVVSTSPCLNNTYSFAVTQLADGFYSYYIYQISSDGLKSSSVPFLWVKKTTIAKPYLTSPSSNPYLSSESVLSLAGTCETGATVTLSGDGTATTICQNSHFTLSLPKAIDGDYNLVITQTDPAGNFDQVSLQWKKKALVATPQNPTIVVAQSQNFSFSGGTGTYTSSLSINNSGATYNSTTQTYTAGTLANVIDTILVQDSAGTQVQILIRVAAADPDHLSYPTDSGDDQTPYIGDQLSLPIKAIVVDRYENPIFGYPLFAQVVQGDAKITSSIMSLTDLAGTVQYSVVAGSSFLKSKIIVRPVTGYLPDLAGSGRNYLPFKINQKFKNNNNFGLTFAAGQVPSVVKLEKINNDNILDAVVLNSGDPSIGLFFGVGNGLFENMRKINSICQSPTDLVVVDLNNDGLKDIVITCGNSLTTSLQYFLNMGDGLFGTANNIALDVAESLPSGLIVTDVDKDGKLDLVSVNAASSNVSIRYGQAGLTFSAPVIIDLAPGSSATSIAAGDFNKDGNTDFVVTNSALDSYTIIYGLGSRTFDSSLILSTGTSPIAVQVKDFNKDGYEDMAILNSAESKVSVLINDKSGGFTESVSLPVGDGSMSILSADINSDGKDDLIVPSNTDSTISIFLGYGTGFFETLSLTKTSANPASVAVGLVNSDSVKDIVVVAQNERVLQVLPQQVNPFAGPMDPSLYFGSYVKTKVNPSDIVFEDFNSDGKTDMAVLSTGDKTVDIYYGDGEGQFNLSNISLSTNDSSVRLVSLDTRNLNRKDLIVVNPNRSSIRLFLNNADGSYQSPVDLGVGSSPQDILVKDFNRDGYVDLAVVNSGSNNVSILIGNGDGTFKLKQDYDVGNTPAKIAVSDINLDNEPDLVVTNKASNSFSVLLSNGNGTFRSHIDTMAGNAPTALSLADVNKDGFDDAIVVNSADGMISVHFGNGDGSFRAAQFYSCGLNPDNLITGDFNGDNRIDVAVTNGINLSYTVLYSSISGQFNLSDTKNTGFTTTQIKAADVNKDGSLDFIVFDSISNQLEIEIGH